MPAHRKPTKAATAAGVPVATDPIKHEADEMEPQAYVVKSSWLRDAAERVLATFAQAFLGVFGATQIIDAGSGHLDVSVARMALAAGIAAVLALLKAWLAKYVTRTVSPASLAPTPAPKPVAEAGYSPLDLLVWVLIAVILVLVIVFLAHQV